MRSRPAALVAVGVVVGVLVLVWWWSAPAGGGLGAIARPTSPSRAAVASVDAHTDDQPQEATGGPSALEARALGVASPTPVAVATPSQSERTWRVGGRVTDADDDKPIEGVRVSLLAKNAKPLEAEPAISDAEGHYELVVPAPRLASWEPYTLWLRASKKGWIVLSNHMPNDEDPAYHPDDIGVAMKADSTVVSRDIAMVRGVEISGRVRHADGRPAAGGFARAEEVNDHHTMVAGRRMPRPRGAAEPLGADGSFRVLASRQGNYVMGFDVQDYGRYFHPRPFMVGVESIDGIEVELPAPLRVAGIVVGRQDEPIAGARVEIVRSPDSAVESDDEGRFAFERVVPGAVWLKAAAEGYAQQETFHVAVEPGRPIADIRLVLDPAVVFGGRVVDASDKPVPRANLAVFAGRESATRLRKQTDDAGEFAFGTLPLIDSPRVEVTVATEKYEFTEHDFELGRTDNVLRLERIPRCTLVFSVLDAVTRDPVDGLKLLMAPDGIELVVEDAGLGILRATGVSPKSQFAFKVGADDHAAVLVRSFELAIPAKFEDGEVFERTIELPPLRVVRGRLVRADNKSPVADASVVAVERRMAWHLARGTQLPDRVVSDAEGRFELREMPHLMAVLRIEPPAPLMGAELSLPSTDQVEIDLGDIEVDAGHTVRVRVVDGQGRGRSGVIVTAMHQWMNADDMREATRQVTDTTGWADFTGLPHGKLVFRLPDEDLDVWVRESGPPPQIIVPTGKAIARILVRSGGEPVMENMFLSMHRDLGDGATMSVERRSPQPDPATGFRELGGLAAGAWKLRVSGNGPNRRHNQMRDVEATLREAEPTDIIVDLHAGAVHGIVVDENNRPMAAASVVRRGPFPSGVTCDNRGEFAIEGLSPGPIRLMATTTDGRASDWAELEIAADQATNLRLVVRPRATGSILVTARRSDTAEAVPISGISLFSGTEGHFLVSQGSRADGTWLLEGVPVGEWLITTLVPELDEGVGQAKVVAGQTIEVETTHAIKGSLIWSIVDERGRPLDVTTAIVGLDEEGRQHGGRNSYGGMINEKLPPGRYRATAPRQGEEKRYGLQGVSTEFVIEAGKTTNLRTVLPPLNKPEGNP